MKKYIFLLIIVGTIGSCTNNFNIDVVTISGRQILVNDSLYTIKGICYHSVPKGSDSRSFNYLTEDLVLMVEAGINTIRVYEPIDDKAVLDEINAAGLKIIIGFGFNEFPNFLRSETTTPFELKDCIKTRQPFDELL